MRIEVWIKNDVPRMNDCFVNNYFTKTLQDNFIYKIFIFKNPTLDLFDKNV